MENKEPKKKNEFLYFTLRNTKLKIGLIILLIFIFFALIGQFFTKHEPNKMDGKSNQPPSKEYWLGTTKLGQDVFAQLVQGTQLSFLVGIFGGGLATVIGLLIGFFAGYKGGWIDELLMMITNIILVVPTLCVLIILAAYLPEKNIYIESVIIGLTSWPWVARAVRSQTFSLKAREFVDLSRITSERTLNIIIEEIAPNMMSYVFMVFILQFGGSILIAAGLDFIGLGPDPSHGISLGLMMQYALHDLALYYNIWWWFIPPGLIITLIVSALYFMNTGLDEIFNPKLRTL